MTPRRPGPGRTSDAEGQAPQRRAELSSSAAAGSSARRPASGPSVTPALAANVDEPGPKAPPAEGGAVRAAVVAREREEGTEFLLQSLRDLERERAAGDLDDDDYAALHDDYTARAAAALRAEQRGQAPPVADARSRPWAHRLLVVLGVAGFAVLAGVLVAQAAGRRQQGQGITGDIAPTATQAANRCIDLMAQGELVDAVPCFERVLDDDPDNPVAHTYLGWTLVLTARQAGDSLPDEVRTELYLEARNQLDAATDADARYADARAFQVVVAVWERRFEDAAAQLEAFDQLDAPADVRRLVDGERQAIDEGLAADVSPSPTTSEPTSASSTTAG